MTRACQQKSWAQRKLALAKTAKNAKKSIGLLVEAIDGNVNDQSADFVFGRPFSFRGALGVLGESSCVCRKIPLGEVSPGINNPERHPLGDHREQSSAHTTAEGP